MATSVSSRRPQLSSRIVLAFFMVATVLTALLYTKLLAAVFTILGIKASRIKILQLVATSYNN